ncbi:hypothetical protein DFH11DRAFT_1545256 [Phellopilus nigrolimitatus]|nr:hypothetical protein DFH11DRAFT_1545256 [Phellopilus nigrolimitatus]
MWIAGIKAQGKNFFEKCIRRHRHRGSARIQGARRNCCKAREEQAGLCNMYGNPSPGLGLVLADFALLHLSVPSPDFWKVVQARRNHKAESGAKKKRRQGQEQNQGTKVAVDETSRVSESSTGISVHNFGAALPSSYQHANVVTQQMSIDIGRDNTRGNLRAAHKKISKHLSLPRRRQNKTALSEYTDSIDRIEEKACKAERRLASQRTRAEFKSRKRQEGT